MLSRGPINQNGLFQWPGLPRWNAPTEGIRATNARQAGAGTNWRENLLDYEKCYSQANRPSTARTGSTVIHMVPDSPSAPRWIPELTQVPNTLAAHNSPEAHTSPGGPGRSDLGKSPCALTPPQSRLQNLRDYHLGCGAQSCIEQPRAGLTWSPGASLTRSRSHNPQTHPDP